MIAPLPAETRLARYLSAARAAWHAEHGSRRETVAGDDDFDVGGTEAELIFCRMANVYPNLETKKPGGADCIVRGLSIDVKWTPRLNGGLLLKQNRVRVDGYVLMRGRYLCAGWMPADMVIDRYLTDLPGGRSYLITADNLLPISSLLGG